MGTENTIDQPSLALIKSLTERFHALIETARSSEEMKGIRLEFLGKKAGSIPALFKSLKGVAAEERIAVAAALNELKALVEERLDERERHFGSLQLESRLASQGIDITLPASSTEQGSIHPISSVLEQVETIFGRYGFDTVLGPSVESEWLNFTALNMPADHPARQMQDSFYTNALSDRGDQTVLRTQTSPVQVRALLEVKPPLRVISGGRTYRRDYDATHSPMFHQVEGLCVERGITFGHLRQILTEFCSEFFELKNPPMRFRPSYFPFTEPSAEVDIGCSRTSTGIEIGKGNQWLEILGCGMVHPQVFVNCGLDPEEWGGFAFGMGVERLAMLKYGIPDLRPMYTGDLEWSRHYGLSPFTRMF